MTSENGDPGAVETMAFVLGLRARGIRDLAVLGAMERVPRDRFAPARYRDLARTDIALPIGCGQTMTAPSVVAAMLAALAPGPDDAVLEIGTGSGYVTALLAELARTVTSVERFAPLAAEAGARLRALETAPDRIRIVVADACQSAHLPDATYDRVLVNGALPELPASLLARLAPGGRLVGAVATEAGTRLAVAERAGDGTVAVRQDGPLRLGRLIAAS